MFMQEVDKVCNADVKRIKTGDLILQKNHLWRTTNRGICLV